MIRALYIIGKWAVQDLACYLAGRSANLEKSKQQSEEVAETRKEAARARARAEDAIEEAQNLRGELNKMVDYVDYLNKQISSATNVVGKRVKLSVKIPGVDVGTRGKVSAHDGEDSVHPYMVRFDNGAVEWVEETDISFID